MSAGRLELCRPVALALAVALVLGSIAAIHLRPAAAEMLGGRARVVDGDTLDIGSQRIRLVGIDAPESGQICPRRWLGTWSCGRAATRALERMIGSRRADCEARGHDKYGRVLGVCTVEGRDINAEMVRQGHAWAFVKYSPSYVEAEAEARAAKIGIWQGDAEPAWAYRARTWQSAETSAPDGCAIKGNITENGRIYHMPWSPWYAKVRVDSAKGERWFCTEADAKEAGWRPAVLH